MFCIDECDEAFAVATRWLWLSNSPAWRVVGLLCVSPRGCVFRALLNSSFTVLHRNVRGHQSLGIRHCMHFGTWRGTVEVFLQLFAIVCDFLGQMFSAEKGREVFGTVQDPSQPTPTTVCAAWELVFRVRGYRQKAMPGRARPAKRNKPWRILRVSKRENDAN